jgi:hypothetical protein
LCESAQTGDTQAGDRRSELLLLAPEAGMLLLQLGKPLAQSAILCLRVLILLGHAQSELVESAFERASQAGGRGLGAFLHALPFLDL